MRKKINIDKAIREIEKNTEYGVCDEKNLKTMWTREVIQIIKDNIKETEDYNLLTKHHELLDKHSKLLDKYIKMGDKYNNLLKESGRARIK